MEEVSIGVTCSLPFYTQPSILAPLSDALNAVEGSHINPRRGALPITERPVLTLTVVLRSAFRDVHVLDAARPRDVGQVYTAQG